LFQTKEHQPDNIKSTTNAKDQRLTFLFSTKTKKISILPSSFSSAIVGRPADLEWTLL